MKKTAKQGKRKPKKKSTGNADGAERTPSQPKRKETDAEVRLIAKLEATIADLRYYYELGVELVGDPPKRLPWGSNLAVEKAKELGVVRDYVEKACQLAKIYRTNAFEALLTHLEEQSKLHSFALSRSHVMATLLLENETERNDQLRDAAENRWSADRLRDEIRSRRPSKSKGGRARTLPKTERQLIVETGEVLRHLVALKKSLAESGLELPNATWKQLVRFQNECDGRLEELRKPEV